MALQTIDIDRIEIKSSILHIIGPGNWMAEFVDGQNQVTLWRIGRKSHITSTNKILRFVISHFEGILMLNAMAKSE